MAVQTDLVPSEPSARVRLRDHIVAGESGQALVLMLISLVVLLGMGGLVVDIGHAYLAQRSIQASADAAALAGASQLPDANMAQATATSYSGASGGKNVNSTIPVDLTTTTRCLSSVPGCSPVNAVVVDETTQVDTTFLKLFGVSSFKVHERSTACSPCSTRPLDIMILLDRTGSMCEDPNAQYDPSCPGLTNAKSGIRTFLGFFDPTVDWVGLAVLPPAASSSAACSMPSTSSYNSKASPYVLVPLSKDYKVNGALNSKSSLVSTLNCVQAGGRTSYATALEQAQAELVKDGRPGVQKVLILFSDGAANLGPSYYGSSSPYMTQPCQQGVNSAGTIKATGTIVYSIGYDLTAYGANVCTNTNGQLEKPSITASQALSEIATNLNDFYNQPTEGQVDTIFTSIAADLSHGTARLIDNNTP